MPRPSVRHLIVESGLEQFHKRGFHNCSIEDITRAAGVPKGSFYNHFASKDMLAIEALHEYQSRSVWRTTVDDADPPLARLRRRFESMREAMIRSDFARGCFIGNMAAEMADLNPDIRGEVRASLDFRSSTITALLRDAQQRGELAADHDPDVLGPFLVNAWEGVVTRTKVCKTTTAMDGFFVVLDQLLGSR